MKKISLLIVLFTGVLLQSCEEKKQTTDSDSTTVTTTTEATDSIVIPSNPADFVITLRDSTNKAWAIMIASDDQKIDDITRLLQEISYCKQYNAMLLDSLVDVTKQLKVKRYKQLTMTSDQIDQYDLFTDKIISRVKYLARTTEELKSHPIAETLYNDIAKADNDVALYRSMYDRYAMAFNNFIKEYKGQLGANEATYKKFPIFSLSVS